MASNSAIGHQSAARHSSSLAHALFGGVFRVVLLLCVALLLSILTEWAGMIWLWPELGTAHSQAMLEAEIQHLAYLQSSNTIVASAANALMLGAMELVGQLIKWTRIEHMAQWGLEVVRLGAVSAINMIYVFSLRLIVLTLSIPTLLIFAIAGCVRGMTGRELRRWGGGRESSGLFHLYTTLMPASVLGLWFLYLSMPVTLNPFWLVGPAAVFVAFMVRGAVYRFKKYV